MNFKMSIHAPYFLLLSALLVFFITINAAADQFQNSRNMMVQEIEDDVRATTTYIQKKKLNPAVLAAMASVPRHEFVPRTAKSQAYQNRPLPIGYGQTISQPYIVALMTDLLQIDADDHVLEIGTGSGYQAAILAELVDTVFTMEIIKPLGVKAKSRLKKLGYSNISVRIGDGYDGWQEEAPFDAIVVTAAASHIPPPLIQQLKPGGRMVIPVGSRFTVQQLLIVEKSNKSIVTTRQILPVRFVPLTGGH